ncbi:MAG: class I SAM-dependent methyltransferase [Candidatus Binatia bacterium]
MSNAERCALPTILHRLKPALSLEIGTYQGGSLQVLSDHSEKVVSLDIDPIVAQSLDGNFPNVEFRSGDSRTVLPQLVDELNASRRAVQFVLIDGDHSADGVCRDIESVLKLNIWERLVVLMHDSFNPECRRGMKEARWSDNKHVHYVELDFTVGNFHAKAYDTAEAGSMWGGFACAVLEPHERRHELVVEERQKAVFDAVFPLSVYAPKPARSKLSVALESILSRLGLGKPS